MKLTPLGPNIATRLDPWLTRGIGLCGCRGAAFPIRPVKFRLAGTE